uniref:N6 adenine-specific DNA methyltransferase N-terminal domain-containing protein n=1 Tax=mine drainage metagenome TaxID=410659 RepID=E6Q9L3_9ZZZZ
MGKPPMPLKKSELRASLWKSCDEPRGDMDASRYRDHVLALLFVKYVSDKHGRRNHHPQIPSRQNPCPQTRYDAGTSDRQDSFAHSETQIGFGQNRPNREDAAVINHFAAYWFN